MTISVKVGDLPRKGPRAHRILGASGTKGRQQMSLMMAALALASGAGYYLEQVGPKFKLIKSSTRIEARVTDDKIRTKVHGPYTTEEQARARFAKLSRFYRGSGCTLEG